MKVRGRLVVSCLLLVLLALAMAGMPRVHADAAGIEFFEKKVRPVLAERCVQCHGPMKQRSGLRLDSLAGILKGGDRGPAVLPKDPEKSPLVQAIRYLDMDLRMPPTGKLPKEIISDLTAWVKMGAPGPKDANAGAVVVGKFDLAERLQHWAYKPVREDLPPAVRLEEWPRNPIDRFILARLEAAGLHPAAVLDKRMLIRRVTFDLIGLPPTVAEVQAFLADDAPDAYVRLVERLLASPHYGERWARHWLDLVRFSESLGHEFDYDIHHAWRYRDYVVRAFNQDLPYDRFVIEHLAGDLLPDPRRHPHEGTNESIVGTASFWFCEGKHGPVDVRQEQADRIDNQIDVLGKAFLAQTIACARCHDHKFDAIPTKDYYALAGYLKSSRYQQAFVDDPAVFAKPARELSALQVLIKQALAPAWREQSALLPRYLLTAHRLLDLGSMKNEGIVAAAKADGLVAARLERWLKVLASTEAKQPEHALHAWHRLRHKTPGEEAGAGSPVTGAERFHGGERWRPGQWFATGPAFRERFTDEADLIVDAQAALPLRLARAGWLHSGLLSPRFEGELRSSTFTITRPFIHLHTAGRAGRINLVVDGFNIIRDPIYGGLTLEVNQEQPQWRRMNVEMWLGHRAYFEVLDSTTPHAGMPLSAEAVAQRPGNGFVAVDEVWFSAHPAPPTPAPSPLSQRLLGGQETLTAPRLAERYGSELATLAACWERSPEKADVARPGVSNLVNFLLDHGLLDLPSLTPLLKEHQAIEARIPIARRAPALADGTGEDEHVFLRGNHKILGERAPRGLLVALAGPHQPEPQEGSGRLELAQRLASKENPLFARVLVNRLWHHHFGHGLVRTPDDFGRMGELPTHPALLDYLATEFVRRDWSIKSMHRLTVLSQTYQMNGRPDVQAQQLDPQNRLWHHRPLRRLEAEAIRDALLTVSGRLDRRMTGPSISPHLTSFMEGRGRPGASGPLDGDGRRSLYLNVRRNFLNPMFLAFDYPLPFSTIGRRSVSNVPAQALTLMNDPFVLQQARTWAELTHQERHGAPDPRITRLYETAFARPPSAAELAAALAFLSAQAGRHGCGPDDVRVWTDLCHVLINVKEFVFVE